MQNTSQSDAQPVAMTVLQFAKWAGVSRSHVYVLISNGRLKAVKSLGRTLILRSEAERWLNSLPAADVTVSEAA